ncbi:xanthine dehydrogenase family protein molybdopterin-binding subunit [Geomonas azotofigens]|uniref:xanthine dehydrogenase family protein molybdopterin-binding subunit n=1 Tax=Geomonas azotofigens TaxID=2843196 RepID=UPI001C110D63|nr:xanthine dehydrogenase family protein molybdopterin-binding subunit [Geomonas azotofigens]MBU5613840.1 xanthine dehydrogenase family protein molybdopterin-binding subunit [Geomonas azotofigens]
MAKEYRYIGKKVPRRDAVDIVTGAVNYLDDLRMAKLLYGKVLRSPHPHALIKNIDKSRAEKLEGVKAVLTWEDVPDWRGGTPGMTRILDRKVRFVGDAVALVAATTEEIALAALRLIDVEYEVLPAVLDIEEAIKPGAPLVYDEFEGNIVPPEFPLFGPGCLTGVSMGDVAQGFDEADVVVEGTCGYQNLPNAIPPEPPGVIALWEEPQRVTIWASTQAPAVDRMILAGVIGWEVDLKVLGHPVGGSFGTKIVVWQLESFACALSKASGMPVKMVLSKEEHLATFVLRPESRMNAKVGMKRDGTVTAVSGTWLVGTGNHSTTTQAQIAVGCGEIQLMTRCRNWDLKSAIVCTNRNASGSVRGFGGQELKCAFVPILCLAMEKLGIDPLDFIKKNFIKPGDGYFWRDGSWYQYRGIDYSPAMDQGAERFGWRDKWRGWLRPSSVNGPLRRGVGVGVHGNADIGEDVSEAYLRLTTDGTATLFSCVTEHGTGQRSNYLKMIAEVLGLPLEKISISPSDSTITPFDFGPVGSRGTYAIGSAAIAAAEDARRKLLELAAPLLDAGVEDLDTEDGMIFVKADPDRCLPWIAVGHDRTILGYGRFEPDFTLANCMTTFVEVEVDTETGKVTLLEVVNATDAGKIIDPPGLEGQLNGCLGAAGIDSALFEETIVDRGTGRILNANLLDYKWRTFAELPVIKNVVLESAISSHRFRAVGVGEVSTAAGPTAILMAVSNAIGVWLVEYPVTPERVLAALNRVAGGPQGGAA